MESVVDDAAVGKCEYRCFDIGREFDRFETVTDESEWWFAEQPNHRTQLCDMR